MSIQTVNLKGWYCIQNKNETYPDLSRGILDDQVFKLSIRSFEVKNLEILEIEKIQNSYFNPVYVRAVIDLKGSLIPFFIERQKVKQLQDLINAVKTVTSITL